MSNISNYINLLASKNSFNRYFSKLNIQRIIAIILSFIFIISANLIISSSSAKYEKYLANNKQCPGTKNYNNVKQQEKTMKCMVNFARKKKGLNTLKYNSKLEKAAYYKNRKMKTCKQFSHTPCNINFSTYFQKAGYWGYNYGVGENLAYLGPAYRSSPYKILNGWLNSTSHRKNLFSKKWDEFGVDYRKYYNLFVDNEYVALWTNTFGTKQYR